jgi:hypothetical protein
LWAHGATDGDEEGDEATAGADLGRRFSHLAMEDKEYFNRSIVEGVGGWGTLLPALSTARSTPMWIPSQPERRGRWAHTVVGAGGNAEDAGEAVIPPAQDRRAPGRMD